MKLLNKLERKFGKYAIHNLMKYIVMANAMVYVLDLLSGGGLIINLHLIPTLVLKGEVWRLFTFVFIPPSTSPIFIIFVLYFYYMIGSSLEQEWGSFKFNVFYFFGVLVMMIASMLTGTIAFISYLNTTLFFAFATYYPNFEVRISFILPVKVKYLAYISAAFLTFQFIVGSMPTRISILAGLANFILFFGKDFVLGRKRVVVNATRKQQYNQGLKHSKETRHKCHVCGRTENDNSSLEFRYCSKCEGYYEYCSDHLFDHQHVQQGTNQL